MKNQLALSFSDEPIEAPAEEPLVVPPPALKLVKAASEEFEPLAVAGHDEALRVAQSILKIMDREYWHFGQERYRVFDTFLEISEYALTANEDAYMKMIGSMKREAVQACSAMFNELMTMWSDYIFADVLGIIYMEIASKSKASWMGQFFTPSHISQVMAAMIMGDIEERIEEARATGRKLSVHDPCVGAGSMLLAAKHYIASRYGLRGLDYFKFTGQDIDPICVRMCRIQMHLTDYRYMAHRMITAAFQAREFIERKKAVNE